MSNLNKDTLFLIFEELRDDSKSLFSCLMVNRIWCETVVPVLWRNPWSYNGINYRNKSYLFIILANYLFDDIKKFITEQGIYLNSVVVKSLLFDYLSFCRSINVDNLNSIFSIGSSLAYNQFFMQQEFYSLFMRKCPELKYFDMRSIQHQIFYFPEAKVRLESLCELKCDTYVNSSYFYGLSRFCQCIQKLVIFNIEDSIPNHGIVRLIEVQKNLKHFEWKDNFYNYDNFEDPYEEILLALEKKAESLNYLSIIFQDVEDYEHVLIQRILPKFYKLRVLFISASLWFTDQQLNQLKMQVYHELEILYMDENELNFYSNIIENSGGRLKKILFRPYDIISSEIEDYHDFDENSLNFIRKVYENCPSIEYLSILISPTKENFSELEKLLKICQNLKSLLIVILDNYDDTHEDFLGYGNELLEILIRSAPINFKEIRFGREFKFSLKSLEKFLENWRGRRALSLFTLDSIFTSDDYTKLINKYKDDKVIKDFNYCIYGINYYIDDLIT
ncbi:hypothetical protein GLOIN_2v1764020 [Rhizophagus irregularis DAOM 181602=DAOM 197198]|nr:hypothetical protein GLOIN_2v1764020 [Rhizophagus irregularis DAOM 181602=DAOM 197198]CAG8484649.1 22016_t:CDS:1 [Rhizophagus irregularis]